MKRGSEVPIQQGEAGVPNSSPSSFAGKTVTFTGQLLAMSREEARLLVRKAGGHPVEKMSRRVHFLVVGMKGWPLLPDGSVSVKLRQGETLQKLGHFIEILPEPAFLEKLQLRRGRGWAPEACTVDQACRLLGITAKEILRCERFGLIRPREQSLDFQDLVSLRAIVGLIRNGMTPEAIARGIGRLARFFPDVEQPLAQVRLIADGGGRLLAGLPGGLTDSRGQLLFDFSPETPENPAPSVRFERIDAGRENAASWFSFALEQEEDGYLEDAEKAYRRVVEIDPGFAEAWYNLANLLLQRGEARQAEDLFHRALHADPDFASAWYNLGFIYAGQDRYAEAEEVLAKALKASPDYADAHFNLAICLEHQGKREKATVHWRAFLRNNPAGEWAEIARNHLIRSPEPDR